MTTLTDILKQDAENMYAATASLIQMVDTDKLGWKPPSGKNWMTTGQLIKHCTNACGSTIKGFVTDDWGVPPEQLAEIPPEEMLTPAEKMPSAENIEETLAELDTDKDVAMKYIEQAGEDNLLNKKLAAPWGGPEKTLFQHLNEMIWHLGQHKAQLFYYLKMQGKDVNTMHLWGGATE